VYKKGRPSEQKNFEEKKKGERRRPGGFTHRKTPKEKTNSATNGPPHGKAGAGPQGEGLQNGGHTQIKLKTTEGKGG